jgi:DNA repair exonuclease SbcCD nuclease subunit
MKSEEAEDVALKLLHTADWHLGRRFGAFSEPQELRLTRARLEVIGRILDLAESRDVDAVLCAGDLFDEPSPEAQWWQGVLAELQKRRWKRPVFLLPGNHDPLTPNSIYAATHPFVRALPDYVHVVDSEDYAFELNASAVLYANPCRSHAGQSNLASQLPKREPEDERIRIGLVHGQTFDIPGHQTTFPIEKGSADARGLDYLAVGDTHGFREVEPDARAPTVYPGAPEPTSFGEQDSGCVALVFFPRDRSRRAYVEKIPVAAWRWREETCASLAALAQLRSDDSLRKTVLRLRLEMRLPLAEYDQAQRILVELEGSLAATGKVGVLTLDRSGLRLDVQQSGAFADDLPPVLRSVLRRLEERAAVEPEKAERALHHLYELVRGGS